MIGGQRWQTDGCEWLVEEGALLAARQLPGHLPSSRTSQERFVTPWRTDRSWFLWVPAAAQPGWAAFVWSEWSWAGNGGATAHRASVLASPALVSLPIAVHWVPDGGRVVPNALACRRDGIGLVSLLHPPDFSIAIPDLVLHHSVDWEGRRQVPVRLGGVLAQPERIDALWEDAGGRGVAWSRVASGGIKGDRAQLRPGPDGRPRVVGVRSSDQELSAALRLDRMRVMTQVGDRLRSM